jgi:hypothetical protein
MANEPLDLVGEFERLSPTARALACVYLGVSSETDAKVRLKRIRTSPASEGSTRFVRTDNVSSEDAATFSRFVTLLEQDA